ncbi:MULTISPECIES: 2,3-bisphosphoglycerate-independent phosphoglycerate mutase [Spirosoma]|uniref:2,3-bisphosphoglycerate-independent phosphoglycerate mutase n=1 Tax=Spirosoma liriopis TaxID=2937440 RepID=A0ABT0HG91_9BACT|nr:MULTISPECIES: 2,3-bisphosphoglycerate-independent phosphoglycerate mutase [Spirosoma]MCK8490640.1 2,3-bisphosphoglycerate-independent phosphoglycerate mutase [Spirosoma liriopis]UHG90001.1 2,3-bisphosphoglycerate-independent phosphoglycerate mutase [Spirosoma oryzicola]
MNKKVILVILDGWGIPLRPEVSAIEAASTPFMNSLYPKYAHSTLEASGLAVGLPAGQMGNSEVGHMNLGAGRIVYQDLVKVNKAVDEHTLDNEPVLVDALNYAQTQGKKVHFIGLVSDGGVHAHINHVKGLLSIAHARGLTDVFVHAFTDGRDTDPKGGVAYLTDLQAHMTATTGHIASVTGRYYAMDRDNRWERVKVAYDAMVLGVGVPTTDPIGALQASYDADVTDEFVKPIINTDAEGTPLAVIEEGDVVLCFNFRTDRGREITQALTQKDFPELGMKKLALHYITMTNYDSEFEGVKVIFDKDNLEKTLGEVIADAGRKQIRIAETEKYPHVTFFFSGGREEPFTGEKRLLCPSPKEMTVYSEEGVAMTIPVKTYDQKPEMAAYDIRDAIIPELQNEETDFVCLNFANTDMVGHTGVFEAVVKAAETADACAQAVTEAALEHGYTTIIIADHGNAEYMANEDGSPNTAHTTNLVPCILVDKDYHPVLNDGKLADIAPTILHLMGIPQPPEMTGVSLINE